MGEKRRLEELWKLHPNTERYSVGGGVVGGKKFIAQKDGMIPVKKGDKIVINGTFTKFGTEGWSDRIGWTTVNGIAIFTAIEDKSEKDRISVEQLIFHLNVLQAGGIAKVYKELKELSLEEILKLPRREDKKNRTPILERMLKK